MRFIIPPGARKASLRVGYRGDGVRCAPPCVKTAGVLTYSAVAYHEINSYAVDIEAELSRILSCFAHMQTLKDKVIVITGASRGIGAGIAELCAEEGARVVLAARTKKDLDKTAKSLDVSKDNIVTVAADVSKSSGMKKIVDAAYKKFNRIDVFVNNAGIGWSGPITEMDEKDFDKTFAVNLKSIFLSFKEMIPRMREQGGGQIINISSMAAKQGVPNLAAYSASKAALNLFCDSVAGEVRNDKIKISVLAPASTDTSFGSGGSRKKRPSSSVKKKLTVQEVAQAVVFMARQNENAWLSMADIRPLVKK